MVSGSFHSFLRVLFTFPLQYWFAIGLSVVFSLTRWCWHIQTEFLRFRPTHVSPYIPFVYGTFTLYGPPFQKVPLSYIYGFWAPPFSLATTHGITIVLFSSGYLDVSVLRVVSRLAVGLHIFNVQGCPIRTSMDLRSFATPHSFSQLTTSFVVSESQGIHHTPLFASYSYVFSNHISLYSFLLLLSFSRVSTLSFLPTCQRTFILLI